jgi:hypothetical protein
MSTTTDDGNGKTANFARPGKYTRATTKARKVEWYSKTKKKDFYSEKKKGQKKGKDWVGGSFYILYIFSIFSCCTKRVHQSQEDLAKSK